MAPQAFPVVITGNSLTHNRDGAFGAAGTAIWPLPAPEFHQAVVATGIFRVVVPWPATIELPQPLDVTLEIFGDDMTDHGLVLDTQGEFFLARHSLVNVSVQPGGLTIDLPELVLPDSILTVTATATLSVLGSTPPSKAAVVFRTTDTCTLCACVGTVVNCRGRGLTFVPSAIPDGTTALDLSDNPVRVVSAADWTRLLAPPALRVLNMTSVSLASFDADGVNSLSLTALYLAFNALSVLPDFAVLAPNLETLSVAHNLLVAGTLPANFFGGLPRLTEISIAGCGLATLPDGLFAAQTALLTLDLSGNFLTDVTTGVLSSHLTEINFLAATQAVAGATVDIAGLPALQGMFWLDGNCAAGFYGVGGTVCLRCPTGTFKAAGPEGRPSCVRCPAGTVDGDGQPRTPCNSCPAGTYTPAGSSGECGACPAGTTDDDRSASTPCVACPAGTYAPANSSGPCAACPAGTTDHDGNPATACVACNSGVYAPANSSVPCALLTCPAGTVDHDGSAATACEQCPVGHFAPPGQNAPCAAFACAAGTADTDSDPSTPCVNCGAGHYQPAGSSGTCATLACPAGSSDLDSNTSTPCVFCGPGAYAPVAAAGPCVACRAGTIDADFNASTACVPCRDLGYAAYVPPGSAGACTQGDFRCAAADDVVGGGATDTPCVQPVAAKSRVGAWKVGVAAGIPVAVVVTLLVLGLFFRWQRQQLLVKKFSFQQELDELLARGIVFRGVESNDFGRLLPREIPRHCVKKLAPLGEGAFGAVFKGAVEERGARGLVVYNVAIKMLKNAPSASETKQFMSEAALMAPLQHPNIVSLVGVVTAGEPRMLLMQFCEHGSLLAFLQQRTGFHALVLESKYRLMADVADGMLYLSSCRIVHRDLACRNVLVHADFSCKIADFGMSREMAPDDSNYFASDTGTVPLRWTAPEALNTRQYSTASDVWSFAVLCGEIFDNGAQVGRVFFFHFILAAAVYY